MSNASNDYATKLTGQETMKMCALALDQSYSTESNFGFELMNNVVKSVVNDLGNGNANNNSFPNDDKVYVKVFCEDVMVGVKNALLEGDENFDDDNDIYNNDKKKEEEKKEQSDDSEKEQEENEDDGDSGKEDHDNNEINNEEDDEKEEEDDDEEEEEEEIGNYPKENMRLVVNKVSEYLKNFCENYVSEDGEVIDPEEAFDAIATPAGDDKNENKNAAFAEKVQEEFNNDFASVLSQKLGKKAAGGSLMNDDPLSDDKYKEMKENIQDVGCVLISEGLSHVQDRVKDFSSQAQKNLYAYKKKKGYDYDTNGQDDDNDDDYEEEKKENDTNDDDPFDEIDDNVDEGEEVYNRQRATAILMENCMDAVKNKPMMLKFAKRSDKVKDNLEEKIKQVVEASKQLEEESNNNQNGMDKEDDDNKEDEEGNNEEDEDNNKEKEEEDAEEDHNNDHNNKNDYDDEEEEKEEEQEEMQKMMKQMANDYKETEELYGPGGEGDEYNPNNTSNGSYNNEKNSHSHYYNDNDDENKKEKKGSEEEQEGKKEKYEDDEDDTEDLYDNDGKE